VVQGTLYIEEGVIVDMIEGKPQQDVIVAPCFVNAHTHIGDSVLKDPVITTLDELVRPPDGLKHRILKSTHKHELTDAMCCTMKDMKRTGTAAFVDFREGGAVGAGILKEALVKTGGLRCRIFGRPADDDLSDVLSLCDGIGLSGARDLERELLFEIRDAARKRGKPFAIHAGERDSSDIDAALELEPDFVVHLTHGNRHHFERLVEQGCGVVVCPRSNFITGAGMPDIKGMLECGVSVAVGTDNVMLNSVNMFSEMEFISKIFLHDDRQVFKLCTLNGAKISGMDDVGYIETGKKACLMLLDKNSCNLQGVRDLLAGLVRRARPDDIMQITGV
jgi:cytosine/adenosine deaminase-related metal-dependent hydrolase